MWDFSWWFETNIINFQGLESYTEKKKKKSFYSAICIINQVIKHVYSALVADIYYFIYFLGFLDL